jgi:hypothetical protein
MGIDMEAAQEIFRFKYKPFAKSCFEWDSRWQKLMLDSISTGIYGLKVQGFLIVQRWWTTPQ